MADTQTENKTQDAPTIEQIERMIALIDALEEERMPLNVFVCRLVGWSPPGHDWARYSSDSKFRILDNGTTEFYDEADPGNPYYTAGWRNASYSLVDVTVDRDVHALILTYGLERFAGYAQQSWVPVGVTEGNMTCASFGDLIVQYPEARDTTPEKARLRALLVAIHKDLRNV